MFVTSAAVMVRIVLSSAFNEPCWTKTRAGIMSSVAANGASALVFSPLVPDKKVISYNATTTGRVAVNSFDSMAATAMVSAAVYHAFRPYPGDEVLERMYE